MVSRRFLLLAAVLVTLNVALWLTPVGLALRQVALPSLFGKNLVRAEVIVNTGTGSTADWRVDRGVITQVSSTQLTLKEADGRLQAIGLSSATGVVTVAGRVLPPALLTRGWRVLVTWPANGTADLVKVEKRGKSNGLGGGRGRSHG